MNCASSNIAVYFMTVLLPNVLDSLEFEELLLSAMPVNRYWREQAVSHRTYWYSIRLNIENPLGSAARSVDLFLLRLSRTGDRPVDVFALWDDLATVIQPISQHLHHIDSLFLHAHLSSAAVTLEALRSSSAPMLRFVTIQFWMYRHIPVQAVPVLPVDFFAWHAPRLKHITLMNIAVRSGANFPTCLNGIRSLSFHFEIHDYPIAADMRRLPSLSQHFPCLRALALGNYAVLDDPSFWEAATWLQLDEVRRRCPPALWDASGNPPIPISQIRQVRAYCTTAIEVLELAGTIPGPLAVSVLHPYIIPRRAEVDDHFKAVGICISVVSDPMRRERWIETHIPNTPPVHSGALSNPHNAILAFQCEPSLAERIVRLAIPIKEWADLVGAGYFTGFPALRILVALLTESVSRASWYLLSPSSMLSCPGLQRLVLRRIGIGSWPRVEVAQVSTFATTGFPDARFPLVLECVEVDMVGSVDAVPSIFSKSILTRAEQLDDAGVYVNW